MTLGARSLRPETVPVSDASTFELERDEPLAAGDFLHQFSTVYEVKAIRPLSAEEADKFDAVAEVERQARPAQGGVN
jgi:hypothetical protein